MVDPADETPIAAGQDDAKDDEDQTMSMDNGVAANRSLVDQDNEDDDDSDDNADDADDEEEEQGDPLAHLPPEVRACIQDLKVLEQQRKEQVSSYLVERAALERKYQDLIQPLYERRRAIVPQIPQFWACALTNNDTAAEWINEDDAKALEYLTDITNRDRDDGKGFTLTFHFATNDYFTNTTITKTYVVPNLLLSDEPNLKLVAGDTIHWKKGKSLTHREVIRKQRGKGKHAGRIRTVTKQEEMESFFTWFAPPPMPVSADEMDEEEADRLDEIFELDYELAQAIRSEIIPQAVLWFTDEASHMIPVDNDDDDNNDNEAVNVPAVPMV
jgi:nucleosome assembly protein 1-like 1